MDPFSVVGMAGDLDPAHPYDVIVAVPASHYMAYNPVTGYYRSHINFASTENSYVGSNLMYGHDMMFDFERNRIGIAEVTKCVPKIKGPVTGDDDVFETPFDVRDDDTAWRGNNEGNDDLEITGGIGNSPLGPGSAISVTSFGTCESMVCRLFVGTGYVAILVFASLFLNVRQFGGKMEIFNLIQMLIYHLLSFPTTKGMKSLKIMMSKLYVVQQIIRSFECSIRYILC